MLLARRHAAVGRNHGRNLKGARPAARVGLQTRALRQWRIMPAAKLGRRRRGDRDARICRRGHFFSGAGGRAGRRWLAVRWAGGHHCTRGPVGRGPGRRARGKLESSARPLSQGAGGNRGRPVC